jgi:hypothetical protein
MTHEEKVAQLETELNSLQPPPSDRPKESHSQYATPDAPVGSNAYFKRLREANKKRMRVYNRRSYLKRKLQLLHTEALRNTSVRSGAPPTDEESDAELRDIEERIEAIREVRKQYIAEGRIAAGKPAPYIAEVASRHNVPYAKAKTVMHDEEYDNEADFDRVAQKQQQLLDLLQNDGSAAAAALLAELRAQSEEPNK